MARRARWRRPACRARACAISVRPARLTCAVERRRDGPRERHSVHEHDSCFSTATVSGRPPHRREARRRIALERARDGGPRQPRLWRTGGPHCELRIGGRSVRSRLQSFLSRRERCAWRRSHLFPAAFVAGRLCARISRRLPGRDASRALPARDRGTGLVFVSASVADAGLLAVPDGLDGHRAHQRYLPGALHAIPAEPWIAEDGRPQGVGLFRRRRDGRAGIDRRVVAGGARRARQPGVRDQLQSAAARWPRAEQRTHHRRTRSTFHGRGLERHQGAVGLGLGCALCGRSDGRSAARVCAYRRRSVPDLLRQRRRIQPRALLRPEPRACRVRRTSEQRRHRPLAARRPRRAQAPCCV
ncbi:hypothetical protein LMG28138_05476 [Pararobbsia alpina]|uniref:Uncharacterized protein n=1 Tax=Pararobbsia alpina TaxID=621374 RepID=A0A6S7DFQ8_9BURK|nr:hypothetical protein LMG28138_05476 [Pararobbsia alpina]